MTMDQLTTQVRIFENAMQPAIRAYERSEKLRSAEGEQVSEAEPLKRHAQELARSAGRAMRQLRDLDPERAARLREQWRQHGVEHGVSEESFWAVALGLVSDTQDE